MQVVHNGITLIVPDHEVVGLALARLNGVAQVLAVPTLSPPRIGQYWQGRGGIYAGICAGGIAGLDRDYHLILGPEYCGDVEWQPCLDWAPTLEKDGHTDFDLPFRKELRVLYANIAGEFKQQSYWSREQHASDSSNAWNQDFGNGYQGYWYEDNKLRGRAVRRSPI